MKCSIFIGILALTMSTLVWGQDVETLGHRNLIGGFGHDTVNSFGLINSESQSIGVGISMARKVLHNSLPDWGLLAVGTVAGLPDQFHVSPIDINKFRTTLNLLFNPSIADLINSGKNIDARRAGVRASIIQISKMLELYECSGSGAAYYYYEYLTRKGLGVYSKCFPGETNDELLILDID